MKMADNNAEMRENLNNSNKQRRFCGSIWIWLWLLVAVLPGCNRPDGVPITIVDQRQTIMQKCSRIDIDQECVEEGLGQLFTRMAETYGPFESEPLIRDYAPMIQQGLYRHGFCSIENLHIHGQTFDIDIFFLAEPNPSSLNLAAFVKGQLYPVISLANRYYVEPQ